MRRDECRVKGPLTQAFCGIFHVRDLSVHESVKNADFCDSDLSHLLEFPSLEETMYPTLSSMEEGRCKNVEKK